MKSNHRVAALLVMTAVGLILAAANAQLPTPQSAAVPKAGPPTLAEFANTDKDATAVLQAAVDADGVIPPGTYRFTGQLRVPDGKSLIGVGPTRVRLEYTGPPRDDGCVLIPAKSWAYTLKGFTLIEPKKSKTGTGIRGGATDIGQIGTQSGFARIDDVWVDGFAFGLRFGDKKLNSSSSEVTATNLHLSDCDVGCRIETPNSLDFTFVQLGATDCRVALESDMAGCVHIVGGSMTKVSEAVWSLNGAGVYSIRNLRTEHTGYLVVQGFSQSRFSITIDSCETNANIRADKVDVLVRGGAALAMTGGTYDGTVRYEGAAKEPAAGYGTVTLTSVGTRRPTLVVPGGRTNARYSIRGCFLLDQTGQASKAVPDTNGSLSAGVSIPIK